MNYDSKRVLDLAIEAGEILLLNGAEIFRVQQTMEIIARYFQAESFHVYVVTNGLFASVEESGKTHSTQIRTIPLSSVHLGRVAAVNTLSRDIVQGKLTLDDAFQRLEEIRRMPVAKPWVRVLSAGMGCFCFCYLFGGTVYDSVTSLLCGLALGLFLLLADRYHMSRIITNILGSASVALCGVLLFKLGMGVSLDSIIIGAIVPLMPGVALTTSIRDFLNSDYLSGIIRLIDALLIAACIAIGVGAVLIIFGKWLGVV